MGSGYHPGSDKAAYMRDLQLAVNPREFLPVSRLAGATNSSYYSVDKYSNTSFSNGGPAHGAVVNSLPTSGNPYDNNLQLYTTKEKYTELKSMILKAPQSSCSQQPENKPNFRNNNDEEKLT
ncbi:unnamed protein product [Eruca vesicaria subsp. sativa]|uniref:Uncharacterized protein n=1 Tax=Eruca vesicaria subsp. sativa TaxID=29727 RepID=A0ABC8KRQ5_ERUVS|nr:unnamed protein product [Eruca vesicaria subsp. sativa]